MTIFQFALGYLLTRLSIRLLLDDDRSEERKAWEDNR